MRRRLFNRLMSLGAGALGIDEAAQGQQPGAPAGSTPFQAADDDPVNIADVRELAKR